MAYSDLITGVGTRAAQGGGSNAEITRRLDAQKHEGGVGATFGAGLRQATNSSVRAVTSGAVVFDRSDAAGSFDSKNYAYVFDANPELGDYIHQVGTNTQLDKVRGTLQQQLDDRQGQIDDLKAKLQAQGGTTGGGPTGELGAPSAQSSALSQQLEQLEQQQAVTHGQLASTDLEAAKAARMQVEVALKTRYSAGAALPSFADSGVDPMDVKPKNQAEAEAFVQRLTIDMGVGVAELDYLQAQIKVARTDLAQGGPTVGKDAQDQLQALLTQYRQKAAVLQTLTKKYETQKTYVSHLVDTYETRTGKQVDGSPLPANVASETPAEKTARLERGIEGVRELNDGAAKGSFAGYDTLVQTGVQAEIKNIQAYTQQAAQQNEDENVDFEKSLARRREEHGDEVRQTRRRDDQKASEQREAQRAQQQAAEYQQFLTAIQVRKAERSQGQ